MWTMMIALVRELIFVLKSSRSILRLSSILTITGFAEQSRIASTVAIKLKDWVITSSPAPMLSAFKDKKSASVPLPTPIAYFAPVLFAKFFSQILTKIQEFFLDTELERILWQLKCGKLMLRIQKMSTYIK